MGSMPNVREMIQLNISKNKNTSDKIMPKFLFVTASISILTTVGIRTEPFYAVPLWTPRFFLCRCCRLRK